MSLRIIVLAKQVPDTRNVGKDAMKEDGTVNRAALPAIFNPEDLNALEQALRLEECLPRIDCYAADYGTGTCLPESSVKVHAAERTGRLFVNRPCLCRSRYTGNIIRPGYGYQKKLTSTILSSVAVRLSTEILHR